ncbi:GMC oxidoreductase [Coprinopsis marcescibilis]|uniref:pyranose dehydrogenase (acceptor) n=1 Tax=Coprinopsis marcescibilis TaxID=230819 RepID=A0A5C3L373_COPMA|nr:GMC oxidoreductase [Coprinopsis marcescibilis]
MPIYPLPQPIIDQAFDYVVVGAGTSGLSLAARLAEDRNVSVLVLEAGGDHTGDNSVEIPAQYGSTFTNPKYDWAFKTVKQKHSNNHESFWPRGKGLGGSSGMNFFCWIKPPAYDIDAFEKLGNPGWNWASFEEYSKKSETFHPVVEEIANNFPQTYNPKSLGTSGPIQVTVPLQAHTVDIIFQDALAAKGVKTVEDPYGGDTTGIFVAANSVDPRTWKRSYAATGYLDPNQERPNLHILMGAYATRIIWSDEKDNEGNLIATGIEYIHGEEKKVASASREVILSAGAVKSPQILELSGIGRKDVLAKAGVDLKLELPGVGENVQEHNYVWVIYELDTTKHDHQTLDLMFDPGYIEASLKLHAEGKGLHRLGMSTFAFLPLSSRDPAATKTLIDVLEKDLNSKKESGEVSPSLAKQYDIQLSALRDDSLPDMEFIVFPGYFGARESQGAGRRFLSIVGALNHPISRGYIHIKNDNPLDNPEIDANYFGNNFDLKVLLEHVKYIRSLSDTEPFKAHCIKEAYPGPSVSSDEDVENYIKDSHVTTYHTVGSCSMLPREDAGVVDPKLKVYGTKNVRVVDISIVPIQVAAHLQTTAYVIGEKAADIIKAEGA